jgi:hypothetical protein
MGVGLGSGVAEGMAAWVGCGVVEASHAVGLGLR